MKLKLQIPESELYSVLSWKKLTGFFVYKKLRKKFSAVYQ